jgi:glycosyltransferase involved in cell wall biosynthesis
MTASVGSGSAVRAIAFDAEQLPAGALRVIHVVNELQLAGLERVVAELVEGQRLSGIAASAAVVHDAGALGQRLVTAGYPLDVLNAPKVRPWQRVPELSAMLRMTPHDIVHMHGGNWWSYARSIRAATNAPFVYTLHGEQYPKLLRIRLVEFLGALQTDQLVLVSEDLRHYAHRWRLDRWCPTTVVRNGIVKLDLDFERPARVNGPIRILQVARLDEVKRQDVTLRALRELLDAGIDARVDFCGRGSDQEAYVALSKELGVEERVSWLGVVTEQEVHRRMLVADVMVLPSDSEGTSIALLEAVALQLPCVVSNVGDSGVVMREAPEWIIERNDVAGLRDAVTRIVADPAAARRTAQRVKLDAGVRFGRRAMVDAYAAVYERARRS